MPQKSHVTETHKAIRRAAPGVALALALLVIACLTLPPPVCADTLVVCPSGCEYRTIQGALYDVKPGDTVLVGPGTYEERIWLKPEVHVKGAGADVTFLRSPGGSPTIVGTGNIGAAIVEGFTIIGNPSPTSRGGGIYIDSGAKEIIRNNVFTGCLAYRAGGAIYIKDPRTEPIIENNVFYGNRVSKSNDPAPTPHPPVGGGAIYVEDASPIIRNNEFINNASDKHGGAIEVRKEVPDATRPETTIANNTFRGNMSPQMGGAIHVEGAKAVIRENQIISNTAEQGAGICVLNSLNVTIQDNVIQDNQGYGLRNSGGGISLLNNTVGLVGRNIILQNRTARAGGIHIDASSPKIMNNVLAGNAKESVMVSGGAPIIANNTILGSNVANTKGITLANSTAAKVLNNIIAFFPWGVYGDGTGKPTVIYNDFWSNGQNAFKLTLDPTNLMLNPHLVDPANGDYHLAADSPLIDVGTGQDAPNMDFEQNARPLDGNGDGIVEYDIGADEFWTGDPITPTATPTATTTLTITPTPTVTSTATQTSTPTRTGTPVVPLVQLYLPVILRQ